MDYIGFRNSVSYFYQLMLNFIFLMNLKSLAPLSYLMICYDYRIYLYIFHHTYQYIKFVLFIWHSRLLSTNTCLYNWIGLDFFLHYFYIIRYYDEKLSKQSNLCFEEKYKNIEVQRAHSCRLLNKWYEIPTCKYTWMETHKSTRWIKFTNKTL